MGGPRLAAKQDQARCTKSTKYRSPPKVTRAYAPRQVGSVEAAIEHLRRALGIPVGQEGQGTGLNNIMSCTYNPKKYVCVFSASRPCQVEAARRCRR